jgi:transcriptional regulator with XRE-family HTH domain
MFSIETKNSLEGLGLRFKQARLGRDETQGRFAARLGISIPTLRKMERGDPSVPMGRWVEALFVLDRLGDLDTVLKKPETLFDKWEIRQQKTKQRASKRKIKHDKT